MASALRSEERHIAIYADNGCELDICRIFPENFQFQSFGEGCARERTCCTCLKTLQAVHRFYESIATAQDQLSLQECFTAAETESDPLPQDVPVQCNVILNTAKPTQIDNTIEPEVKLEFIDLDFLPKIEIIEETTPNHHERPQRACRRRCVAPERPINAGKQNESTRRHCEISNNGVDVAGDLLINVDLNGGAHDNVNTVSDNAAATIAPSSAAEPQKRRRGRPRKLAVTVSGIVEPQVATIAIKTKFGTNQPSPASDLASDELDGGVGGADGCVSSNSDSCQSHKSLKDFVLESKTIAKPKTTRKRQRSPAPTRMTRVEIEQKNAQKLEYDRVIVEFFGSISCPKCNVSVKTFDELHTHLRMIHGEKFGFMSCCGRKFNKRRTLAEHVYVHNNPEYFKCTKCVRALPDRYALRMHELSHTNTIKPKEKQVFCCDQCPKVFVTKDGLEDHGYSKHIPKSEFKFSCLDCDKKLPTKRRLKEHMKFMHNPEGAIICDKCGKKVRNQAYLKKHHEIMHPDASRPAPTPMQCELCGTWYRHLTGLKNHMKSIHDDSGIEHRCSICNYVSVNARALGRHIYHMHTCGRKFKCTLCEKAFKRPQDLKEHTSTHTGEALYTCTICPVTFVSKANMYKHRKRLHPVEWAADRCKRSIINVLQ